MNDHTSCTNFYLVYAAAIEREAGETEDMIPIGCASSMYIYAGPSGSLLASSTWYRCSPLAMCDRVLLPSKSGSQLREDSARCKDAHHLLCRERFDVWSRYPDTVG
jgi:hypothetical protein